MVPRWTKWSPGGQLEWTLHFWRFLDFSFTIESVATPQGSPLLSTHSMRPEINQKSKYSIQCGFTCVVTCHVTSLNIQVNQSQNEKLNNYFTIKEQISQSKKCMAKYIDKYVFISILYIYTSTVQVYIYKYSPSIYLQVQSFCILTLLVEERFVSCVESTRLRRGALWL